MQNYKQLTDFAKDTLRRSFANANDADEQIAVIEQAMCLGLPELVAEFEGDLQENSPELYRHWSMMKEQQRNEIAANAYHDELYQNL